tara:strand:- start:31 stop:279 length:249 start_codon:yes stop_codon:yes gene_type:complete
MENRNIKSIEVEELLNFYRSEILDLKAKTNSIAKSFMSQSKDYWDENLVEFAGLIDDLLEIENTTKSLDDYKNQAILSLSYE